MITLSPRFAALLTIAALTSGIACHSDTPGGQADATVPTGPIGGEDRPAFVYVPDSYQPGTPTPLLVLLHGFGASGDIQDLYFNLTPLADSRGFLYARPDGTQDGSGRRFWNATDACCDYGSSGVDDSAYLRRVIEDIRARYTVDPKRIFLLGHSNGGFMSYRMACDHADLVAGVASLAGATYDDHTVCQPSEPVTVLQIHGTADTTVLYSGGIFAAAYPSAPATAAKWAAQNGCSATSSAGATRDLDSVLLGEETQTEGFDGCLNGSRVELWTINGGGHIPTLVTGFATQVLDYLFAHPKP